MSLKPKHDKASSADRFEQESGFAPRVTGLDYMWRRLRRSPVGITGVLIVGIVLLTAALAPILTSHEPVAQNLDKRLLPPAWSAGGDPAFLLGTDSLGRDVLTRLVFGTRLSVAVGVSAVFLAGSIGVTVGLLSGFVSPRLDSFLMRIVDTFLSIPYIILVLAIVGILGPSPLTLVIVLGGTAWVTYARVVRGEALALREQQFVEAARAAGVSRFRIAVRHVLPNVMGSVIVLATLNVATTIIAESALSFLGLGVQPPTVTWGNMLAQGREYISTAWWLATFPGMAITICVLGIIFLGDWLRDVLDPRLR